MLLDCQQGVIKSHPCTFWKKCDLSVATISSLKNFQLKNLCPNSNHSEPKVKHPITANDVYSGDHYCGNDRYSGLRPPDDAILFTVSGATAIADKKLEILIKKIKFISKSDYDFASP